MLFIFLVSAGNLTGSFLWCRCIFEYMTALPAEIYKQKYMKKLSRPKLEQTLLKDCRQTAFDLSWHIVTACCLKNK